MCRNSAVIWEYLANRTPYHTRPNLRGLEKKPWLICHCNWNKFHSTYIEFCFKSTSFAFWKGLIDQVNYLEGTGIVCIWSQSPTGWHPLVIGLEYHCWKIGKSPLDRQDPPLRFETKIQPRCLNSRRESSTWSKPSWGRKWSESLKFQNPSKDFVSLDSESWGLKAHFTSCQSNKHTTMKHRFVRVKIPDQALATLRIFFTKTRQAFKVT